MCLGWPPLVCLTRSGVLELEAGAGLWRLLSSAPEWESLCVSEAVFIEVWPESRPESSPAFSFCRLWTERLVTTVSFCNKSATTKK